MSWKKWLIPLAAIPLIALLAYGLTRDARVVPSTLPGKPAPEFALETLDGDTLQLSELSGNVVLLYFWASWCLPCYDEHPLFVAASERYRDEGLRIVGVVYQDTRGNAARWMREMGGDWPNVLDRKSRTAIAYGVSGVPETFFIGRDGRVAYKQIGPVNAQVLSEWIPKLLASEAPTGSPEVGRSDGHVAPSAEFPTSSDTASAP